MHAISRTATLTPVLKGMPVVCSDTATMVASMQQFTGLVTHLLAPAPFGGLEEVVLGLAVGQLGRGIRVRVVTVLDGDHASGGHPFVVRARDLGLEVETITPPRRRYDREVSALVGLLPPGGGVVHTHGHRPDVLGGIAARRVGWSQVSTVHGFTGGDWKNRIYERMQLRALRRADGVVAVSEGIRDRLAGGGVGSPGLRCIPNALAPGTFLSREEARAILGLGGERLTLGWAGRLGREKGADILLEALSLIPDLPLQVSVLGDGPERDVLRSESRRLGLAEKVSWHGAVPGAGRLLRAFDLVVLSSRTEGTPMIVLEALAAGVPVVAAAVGGVPDLVREDGVLVPPADPEALARAIRDTLDHLDAARLQAREVADRDGSVRYREWLDSYAALYADVFPRTGVPLA